MTIAYRDLEDRDRHFVVDSWQRSYRSAHAAGLIQVEDWPSVMIPQLEKVLDKPGVHTVVAYETAERDRIADIYGFIVAAPDERPPLVYFVYVKEFYRRRGHARRLFDAIGINPERTFEYACKTGIVTDLIRKIPCAKFNPTRGRLPPPAETESRQSPARRRVYVTGAKP